MTSKHLCRYPVIPTRKAVAKPLAKKKHRNQISVPSRKEPPELYWGHAVSHKQMHRWLWMSDRMNFARTLYAGCVSADPKIRSGVPVVLGTRVPVSMILANVADDMKLSEIADDLNIDFDKLRAFIHCIAIAFDSPAHEYHSARRVHELETPDEDVRGRGKDCYRGVSE